MVFLVFRSWLLLCWCDLLARNENPRMLEDYVQKQRVACGGQQHSSELICRAMDFASVFYFKKVWCRQRSAATTILLRRSGWPASMVTGAQVLPFRSHAWVEIENRIVNDKPYLHEIYQVLDRC